MRFVDFGLLTEMTLGEASMKPTILAQAVKSIDAMAGMEFEMIVPDVEDTGDDLEQDYDPDERATSFSQIEDFFDDGNYNSRRDVQLLIESLVTDYSDWFMEQLDEKWNEEKEDLLRERFEGEMTEEMANDAGFDSVDEAIDSMIERAIKKQDHNYQNVYDEFLEDYQSQYWEDFQRIWLRENYRYMSDVERSYNITWPYWISNNDGIGTVAAEFEQVIGRPVTHGDYHSGERSQTDNYRVEKDGSLEPSSTNDTGLEFISPPLPISEMFDDLEKVISWAKDKGCYTSHKNNTGLHMNISVQGKGTQDLDYVKLALFLGDEYILKEFGREASIYCEAAMKKIKNIIMTQPNRAKEALAKMKVNLGYRASAIIHERSTSKYTSINVKSGYVEFRSPGGDWLEADIGKLKDTLSRFVVALDIASDPDKYKNEYGKKLYNLLKPTEFQYYDPEDPANLKQPTKFVSTPGKGLKQVPVVDDKHIKDYLYLVSLFSKFTANEITEDQFRSAIKAVRQSWSIEKMRGYDPNSKFNLIWIVTDATGRFSMELLAKSKEDALNKAAEEWGVLPSHEMMQGAKAFIKPAEITPASRQPDEDAPVPEGYTRFRIFAVDDPEETQGTFVARTTSISDAQRQFKSRLATWGWDSNLDDFGYEPVRN
jgi:hypothetical protein